MLEIKTNDGVIVFKPLERRWLDTAVELYNCSGDIRYATGITSPVSCLELSENLDRLEASKNEFLAGIFITASNNISHECQSQLAGVVSGILHEKTLWIKLIAVLPKLRQMGIGTRTTRLLFQYSKVCYGTTEAFLSVIEKNDVGVRFWFSQGFSEAGRFIKVLFDGEQPYEVVIMHKRL